MGVMLFEMLATAEEMLVQCQRKGKGRRGKRSCVHFACCSCEGCMSSGLFVCLFVLPRGYAVPLFITGENFFKYSVKYEYRCSKAVNLLTTHFLTVSSNKHKYFHIVLKNKCANLNTFVQETRHGRH